MTKRESKIMRSFQIKMMTRLAQGKFDAIDLKNDLFVKWLVGHMADARIPFKLVPLGGGVTRIVHSGGLCPLCDGTGMIHGEESPLEETPVLLIPDGAPVSCGGACFGDIPRCMKSPCVA